MLRKRNLLICVVAVAFCFVGTASTKAVADLPTPMLPPVGPDGYGDWVILDCGIDEYDVLWVLLCDLATLDMGWFCLGNVWSSGEMQSTPNDGDVYGRMPGTSQFSPSNRKDTICCGF